MSSAYQLTVTVKDPNASVSGSTISISFDNEAKLGGFLFAVVLAAGDEWINTYPITINGVKLTNPNPYFAQWDYGEEPPSDETIDRDYFEVSGYGHYYLLVGNFPEFVAGAVLGAQTLELPYVDGDPEYAQYYK